MRRRVLGVAVILMVAGVPQVAFPSDAFCDLDHASLAGRDLALHFVPDSDVFVRVMKAGHAVSWTDQMYQQDGGRMYRLYPNQRAPEPALPSCFSPMTRKPTWEVGHTAAVPFV